MDQLIDELMPIWEKLKQKKELSDKEHQKKEELEKELFEIIEDMKQMEYEDQCEFQATKIRYMK